MPLRSIIPLFEPNFWVVYPFTDINIFGLYILRHGNSCLFWRRNFDCFVLRTCPLKIAFVQRLWPNSVRCMTFKTLCTFGTAYCIEISCGETEELFRTHWSFFKEPKSFLKWLRLYDWIFFGYKTKKAAKLPLKFNYINKS